MFFWLLCGNVGSNSSMDDHCTCVHSVRAVRFNENGDCLLCLIIAIITMADA